jgi:hypothetical protein
MTIEGRRCFAVAKTTGAQCGSYALRGSTICRMHGASGKVRAAAARRLQAQHLQGDLGRFLEELEMDAADAHPVTQLTNALARCSAMVAVLGALVGGLGVDDTDRNTAQLVGKDHLGDKREHPYAVMYGQWLDRSARCAKLALDAGIDERAIRLEEEKASLIVG